MRRYWDALRWHALYLLGMLPSAIVTLLGALFLVMVSMSVVIAGLGLLLAPLALVGLRVWTELHRWSAGKILGEPVPSRFRPLRGGPVSWIRQVATDRATWRDLLWMPVQIAVGAVIGLGAILLIGIPIASVLAMLFWWVPGGPSLEVLPGFPMDNALTAYGVGLPALLLGSVLAVRVIPPVARAWAGLTLELLDKSTTEELEKRVGELTETRSGALQAHGSELRRIERDLHDGSQAKLVSISLRLGIAKEAMRDEPETASRLVHEAQESTDAAMGELRTIVRTIYPPILSDRGLNGALHSLVADSAIPTQLEMPETGPLPASVEAAAYFVVAEALTNVAKHSEATFAMVAVRCTGAWLHVEITDDGHGGVDESRGSGVSGIRRRVAALDGLTTITSPHGGPTNIAVELPCAP